MKKNLSSLVNQIIDRIPKKKRVFWILTFIILSFAYWAGDIVTPDPIIIEEWLIPTLYAVLANSLRLRGGVNNDSADEESSKVSKTE